MLVAPPSRRLRSLRLSSPLLALGVTAVVAACARPAAVSAGAGAARPAAEPPSEAAVSAGRYAWPLAPAAPPPDELAFLTPLLHGKQVIGLGEVTHGTHEVFALKTRLVQHLVTALRCRAVAIEMSFGASFALSDYVAGRADGDAAALLRQVGIRTYQTRELVELVEWLRAFNARQPERDRVTLLGFDLQDPRADVRAALQFVRVHQPSLAAQIPADLVAFAAESGPLQTIDPRRVPALRAQLAGFAALLDAQRDALSAAASQVAYQRHRYALDVARSGLALFDEPSEEAAYFRRDREVAAHVLWLQAQAPYGPLALWAHNTHVARDHLEAEAFEVLGEALGRRLGDGYYAIGTAFFAGSVRALYRGAVQAVDVGAPRPGSLEHDLLALGDGAPFFVELRRAHAAPRWAELLDRSSTLRAIGSAYQPEDDARTYRAIVLRRMFDALIFLPRVTAAQPIP